MAPPTEEGSQKMSKLKTKFKQIKDKMKTDVLEKRQKDQEKRGSTSSTKEKKETTHAKEINTADQPENQPEKRIPLSVTVRRSRETDTSKLRSESVQTYPLAQKRDKCSNCCGGLPGKGPASSSVSCEGKCCCIRVRRIKGGGREAGEKPNTGTAPINERTMALAKISRKPAFTCDYLLPGSGDFIHIDLPFPLKKRSKIFQQPRYLPTSRRGNYGGRSGQKDREKHSGLGGRRTEARETWRQSSTPLNHRLEVVPRSVTTYHELLMAPLSLGKVEPPSVQWFRVTSQQRMRGGCNDEYSASNRSCRSISSTNDWHLSPTGRFPRRNNVYSDYGVNVQRNSVHECWHSKPMRNGYGWRDDADNMRKDPSCTSLISRRIRGGCGGSCGQNFQANPCGMPRYDQERSVACSPTSCPSYSSRGQDSPCCQDFEEPAKACCPCGGCGGPACDNNPSPSENSNAGGGCCANAPQKKQPCKCKCQGCEGIRPIGGCGGQTCGRIYSCAGSGGGSCCFPRNTKRRSGSECCGGGRSECGGCC